MSNYVDGPRDQPWEVEESGTMRKFYYVQRHGWDAREPMEKPPYEILFAFTNDARDVRNVAAELAARLNRLDELEAQHERASRLLAAVERLEETTNPIKLSYLLDTWYSAHAGFLAPTLVDALISLGEQANG